MIKALCSCGFRGNLDNLRTMNSGGKNSRNILICPKCESSNGLNFAVEDGGLNKPNERDISYNEKTNEKINLTTKEDFELFKKCIRYWIKHFGLYGWDVHLDHQTDKDSLAYTSYNVPNRSVTIVLSKDWSCTKVTDIQIDKTAFHEIGELLMMRLRFIAEARFISEEEVEEEVHNIIRILERVIWETKVRDFDKRVTDVGKIVEDTVRKNIIEIRTNT